MNPFGGDTAARCYAAGRIDIHPEFVRRIAGAIGEVRPDRALDIGCGTGLSSAPLPAIASRVFGIDASAPMLGEAARRPGIGWVRGLGEALPFRPGAFDLVTMGCSFHWCDPAALLAGLRRILAPGGHLAVYDHHLEGRMEGEPRFAAWFEDYRERFPTPPRHPVFEASAAPAFVPVARERFQHLVPLVRADLVRYVASWSNVLSAVEEGRTTMEEAEAGLRADLEPFFAGESHRRVLYGGVLDVPAQVARPGGRRLLTLAPPATTSRLHDRERSVAFYEERYERGYMEEWPPERKARIAQVLRELPLGATGDALDFGCGNGVLTEIVRRALPGWQVCGTDISRVAIANARERYPECEFLEPGDPGLERRKFDFAFSHHVFEHVFDLDQALDELDRRLAPDGRMLHILPCGNEGSFEHSVCLLRRDGIDGKLGGRFFFEDEGHVRRLTTEAFRAPCATRGFELTREFYANQRDGAIDWITTEKPRFILSLTDGARAVDRTARRKLGRLRRKLLAIAALRLPARIVRERRRRLAVALALPFFPFSSAVDRYWKRKAREEWAARKAERNGSEMTLFFERR